MADRETVIWTGTKGTPYKYWIYKLPANLKSGQDGNYIYAKMSNAQWQPLYIGQGDLGDRTDIDNHHQSACLKRKGATHVHARRNAKESDRKAEEADLLAAHPEAYQPTGCNEKEGG
jgi:hypothetical protein